MLHDDLIKNSSFPHDPSAFFSGQVPYAISVVLAIHVGLAVHC